MMGKCRRWLMPLSWLYGLAMDIRNALFDWRVLPSEAYSIPIINVGNITMGGTGKTPHVEYLIRLLSSRYRVAVLSRGYRRRTRGYLLATTTSAVHEIGDEPWQIKQKFPDIHVAVDVNRRRGITRLMSDDATRDVEVILLDDAFQHRYVKAGQNILLIDYRRLISDDCLLPAGNLRERASSSQRATMAIVTKCPPHIPAISYRAVMLSLSLRPYQQLFFSTFTYGTLRQLWGEGELELSDLRNDDIHVLLLTGIGNPWQMEQDVRCFAQHVKMLTFPDHHYYTHGDAELIWRALAALPKPRVVITTEKDAARLRQLRCLDEEVRQAVYVLPVKVDFMREEREKFDETILDYVWKNKRNGGMAQ